MVATAIRKNAYIICPLCRKGKILFEDADADDVQIRLIIPDSKRTAKYFIKCGFCKRQVGLSLKA